ncbi:MAG: glycerophosphodiester phosphodiesterase [Chitinophagaceae bacterium]
MNIKLILFFLLITGCHTMKNQNQVMPVFDKQGHRGCRGLMPENTIPAMIKAIEIGVTTLEMDAMITKDEKVIISHDAFFNHLITTKADGTYIEAKDEKKYTIFGMTYAETQQFDVGLKLLPAFPQQKKLAVHKPLLSDLIDSVQLHCKKEKREEPFYNIETKSDPATDNTLHPAPEKFVELLMEVIYRKGIAEKVIIQSFDFRTLKILHQKYPSIKTAALIGPKDPKSIEDQIKDLGFTPSIYSPEFSLVNKELVSDCHQRNMKLVPWTVNDKKIIESLRVLGVDGIISDYPDLF